MRGMTYVEAPDVNGRSFHSNFINNDHDNNCSETWLLFTNAGVLAIVSVTDARQAGRQADRINVIAHLLSNKANYNLRTNTI